MKYFTLVLIFAVASIGFFGGYRLITGRDLVNMERISLPSMGTAAQPMPTATAAPTPTPAPTPEREPDEFEPSWVQTRGETELWSGVDERAVSFGSVPAGSYLQVVSPQEGTRLHVFNPETQNYAYIDASAAGPSATPPEPEPATGASSPRSEPQRATPTPSSSTTMVVGNTGGMGVYLRRTPIMADRLRAWADNTTMQVLETGITSEGRQWTKVRAPDGTEGYVPAQYLVAR